MHEEHTGEARSERDGAELRLRESLRVEPPCALYVELDLGSVSVASHAAEQLEIEAWVRGLRADAVDLRIERDGRDVSLLGDVSDDLSSLTGLLGRARLEVSVRLPAGVALDVRTGAGAIRIRDVAARVAAETAAGRIDVDAVDGDALLRTGGGAIRIERLRGDLRARTGGGLIDARAVRGRIDARSLGGAIRLRDVAGRVDARTAAGAISVEFGPDPAGRIETGAGAIDASLEYDAGAELDARSGLGRVWLDPALRFAGGRTARSAQGQLGRGGERLSLRAGAGSIRLRAARTCRAETP